jgi:WD40 repeat protein
VQLWNVTDPIDPRQVSDLATSASLPNLPAVSVAFSPDGRTLAVSTDSGSVQLWNLVDVTHPRQDRWALGGGLGLASAVIFSHDGHALAAAFRTNVLLWNVPPS